MSNISIEVKAKMLQTKGNASVDLTLSEEQARKVISDIEDRLELLNDE